VVYSSQSSFKDYFSESASDYAQYRPHYPDDLFDFLAEVSPGRTLVWDCGTGNGQAAVALARYFEHVVATDASESQIAHATRHSKVTYRVAREIDSGLGNHSVDLITVAQALHWFDLDPFYAECRRVLRGGGIIAVWMYEPALIDPAVDRIINYFNRSTIGPYWPPERRFVQEGYASLPFPFFEISHPTFFIDHQFSLQDLLKYISTLVGCETLSNRNRKEPSPSA
jgi:SAM-dependent methyltransferase